MKGVILGISGGIAVYKAVEILRRLSERGIRVQVVMTAHARKFVAPLTFQALSGQRVITSLFDPQNGSEVEHIHLRREYDLLLVAPATANILGKFAQGIADDFLSTLYLAWNKELIVAPAMNAEMWRHAAVRRNLELLRERGVRVVDPEEGFLACGDVGAGRLADPVRIADQALQALEKTGDLCGKTVLVNAGPTVEAIDPVRFLSNRSSGKMGYALAAEAARRGARVILVSGPVSLAPPAGVEKIPVVSAAEMGEAMDRLFPDADIAILAAAVCDYAPKQAAPQKIKNREQPELRLELKATRDILAGLGKKKTRQLLVGFAAETENLMDNARRKLAEKNVDLLVANDVSSRDSGLESDYNRVTLLFRDGSSREIPRMPKSEVARAILDAVVSLAAAPQGGPAER